MAELQFKGVPAKRVTEHLVPEANSEDRCLPDQPPHRVVRITERARIAGTVRKKNTVRFQGQRFLRRRARWHHRDSKTHLSQPAQDVFLQAVIVGDNLVAHGRQGLRSHFVCAPLRHRPERARAILRVPFVGRRSAHFLHIIHPDHALAPHRFVDRGLLGHRLGCEAGLHRAAFAQVARERARIDSLHAGNFPAAQIIVQRLFRAPTARDIA